MLPFERVRKLNTTGNLWVYILSLLKEKELYGWEAQSLINKEFNFKPGLITSYRVLYRLEKQGFVKSEMRERRRVYEITEKGRKELKKAKNFYKNLLAMLAEP